MITWVEKGRNATNSNADITITIAKKYKDRDEKHASITFRNGCEKRISRTGFVMVGYDENRVYFTQAIDGVSGFKLTSAGVKNGNRYTKVSDVNLLKFAGNYSLLKDAKTGMYYIQKGE